MKLFTKKRLPLFIGIATVLGLAQCDWIRADVSQVLFPPVELDFPMGEGKQVSYPIRSWIDKPYGIGLVAEYTSRDKYLAEAGTKDLPYAISIACYRLEKEQEIFFYRKEYTEKDELYLGGITRLNKSKPYSPESEAGVVGLGGFRLPYGSYRCDFKDTSNPEIKEYLQKTGVVRAFVRIFPYKPIIY